VKTPVAIFYDLETSDKSPIGQILNYSFIAVDKNLSPVAECSGDIRFTRLQLPSPEAILKNRVHVTKHQASVSITEREAMASIAQFIAAQIKSFQSDSSVAPQGTKQKLVFIGYNSSKFDLPFLRTSWIRNGMNPYFGGNLLYKDLLLGVRKLSISHPEFPRFAAEGPPRRRPDGEVETPRLSLSLETITHALRLLEGAQSHHSRDDVLLTIKLAKTLQEKFGLDILTYEPFEAGPWLKAPTPGRIFWMFSPNYSLAQDEVEKKGTSERTPLALLEANYRYALFINLERFARGEGRRSIQWFNQAGGALYFGGAAEERESIVSAEGDHMALGALAAKAREELKGITLGNFFSTSTCDIEQDIYRLDMARIGALEKALWGGDTKPLSELKDREAKIVYLRALLAQYRWETGALPNPPESATSQQDARMAGMLRDYALHRYGGKLQLTKSLEGVAVDDAFHASLAQLYARLNACEAEAKTRGAATDLELLQAVREFYEQSEIVQLAGDKLLATPSVTAASLVGEAR